MVKLYHKDVYWEDIFNKRFQTLINTHNSFVLSAHCLNHIKYENQPRYDYTQDGLNEIFIKSTQNVEDIDLFEVEITDYELTKAVFRIPYDDNRDISIVIRPQNEYTVKIITAWLNDKDDKHYTLDCSKYEIGGD